MAYLISKEEGLEYVQGIENCTLPREKWTHEAHLIVGLFMVLSYQKKALPEMRKRIWQYNELTGKGNDNTGYHETLTVFWLWAVYRFCLEKNLTTFDEVALDELIYDETLAKRKLVEAYYHPAVLMSPYARKHYQMSDLKEMEGIEYFFLNE
jgi:hypothetical protein